LPGIYWEPDNRGAVGAEIETPTASTGVRVLGEGIGVPLPRRLGSLGWGSVVSSRSGVRGRDPAENEFWCIWSMKEHNLIETNLTFLRHTLSHIHIHNY